MEVSGRRSDFTKEGIADELEKLCEVCVVDDFTTDADGICLECEQFMCDTCFRTHLKTKLCRHHVMIDINQIETTLQIKTENVEKCTSHATETIKYYCRKHDTVGCGDCMIPVHGACKPENIKDLSKQFPDSDDFKTLLRNLRDITSANLENDKNVQENKKANQELLAKAMEEITKIRSEINHYLDIAETNIIKDAKDIERNNNKLLAKLEQDCKLLSSKITEVAQKLDTELYRDNALFIQTVDCKPRVVDIEREVSRIQRENDIKTFKFLPDKRLQDIIPLIKKLGTFGKIEKRSTMKPDTARLNNEVRRDGTACQGKQMEQRELVKEKGLEQAGRIAVGGRVRLIESRTWFEQHIQLSDDTKVGTQDETKDTFKQRTNEREDEILTEKTKNEKLTKENDRLKRYIKGLQEEKAAMFAKYKEASLDITKYEMGRQMQHYEGAMKKHEKQTGGDNLVEALRKRCRQIETDNLKLLEQRHVLEAQKDTLETYANQLIEEKDELLLRLSKFAGVKNRAITDLNDPNRPTKLAVFYGDLYNLEWTDAVEALVEGSYEEITAIETLLLTLQNVFKFCEMKAGMVLKQSTDAFNLLFEEYKQSVVFVPAHLTVRHMTQGKRGIVIEEIKLQNRWKPKNPSTNTAEAESKQMFTSTGMGQMKERLKTTAESKLIQLRKDVAVSIVPIVQEAYMEASWDPECLEVLKPFILKCLYLGWMMAVQSPPMALSTCEANEKFDKNKFKEYTKSGDIVDFIVWPALLLEKDGPVIARGVAEAKRK